MPCKAYHCKEAATEIRKLEALARKNANAKTERSLHGSMIYINGFGFGPENVAYASAIEFIKKQLRLEAWSLVEGERISISKLRKLKCEANPSIGLLCESEYGIVRHFSSEWE